MGQRAVRALYCEGDASRIMRCALLLRRHGAAGPTEVALGAEGGFIALPAAPGCLEGREDRVLGELLVHWGSPFRWVEGFVLCFQPCECQSVALPLRALRALQSLCFASIFTGR